MRRVRLVSKSTEEYRSLIADVRVLRTRAADAYDMADISGLRKAHRDTVLLTERCRRLGEERAVRYLGIVAASMEYRVREIEERNRQRAQTRRFTR